MERPILFNADMVNAILAGRKTMTRRVVKPQPVKKTNGWLNWEGSTWHGETWSNKAGTAPIDRFCPYGRPGDGLWVRETWARRCSNMDAPPSDYTTDSAWCADNCKNWADDACWSIEYRADTNNTYPCDWPIEDAKGNPDAPKWRPSIFMPHKASRITLEITDVKVERLQDISEEDAGKEGIAEFTKDGVVFKYGLDGWHWSCQTGSPFMCNSPKVAFEMLWDSINAKKYPWESNPWIWAVSFNKRNPASLI